MNIPINFDDPIWVRRAQEHDQDAEAGADGYSDGKMPLEMDDLLISTEQHLKGHHGKGAVTMRFVSRDYAMMFLWLARHAHHGFMVKLYERHLRLKEVRDE